MEKKTSAIPPNIRVELGKMLLQISDDVLAAINDALKDYQISESKFGLLLILFNMSSDQPLQPSEIADILGVRRASVTKQLIWLEERQLIIRNICPEDKRMVNVTITKEGHRFLDRVLPYYWQACSNLTKKLTDEETVSLLNLLIKIGL